MLKAILGTLAAVVIVVVLCCDFYNKGIQEVVDSCVNYGKYHLYNSTEEMTCSALFVPQDLLPSVADTNAKYYSKENKDKHRKDRK
jgi:hypothetical protein